MANLRPQRWRLRRDAGGAVAAWNFVGGVSAERLALGGSASLWRMDEVLAGVEVRRFAREDLQAVIGLCAAENWRSYTEYPQRTLRALNAAGAVTLVAVAQEVVVGVVQLQSDGEIQAHLTMIVVARAQRGRGIARALLVAALQQAGGMRIDLLSSADGFYRRLGARPMTGFRIGREQLLED